MAMINVATDNALLRNLHGHVYRFFQFVGDVLVLLCAIYDYFPAAVVDRIQNSVEMWCCNDSGVELFIIRITVWLDL